MMKEITIQEFESNFDHYITRVEYGESFKISSQHGSVLLVSHDVTPKIHEEVDYLRNHNDAC